jgi:hypothetical protein
MAIYDSFFFPEFGKQSVDHCFHHSRTPEALATLLNSEFWILLFAFRLANAILAAAFK